MGCLSPRVWLVVGACFLCMMQFDLCVVCADSARLEESCRVRRFTVLQKTEHEGFDAV